MKKPIKAKVSHSKQNRKYADRIAAWPMLKRLQAEHGVKVAESVIRFIDKHGLKYAETLMHIQAKHGVKIAESFVRIVRSQNRRGKKQQEKKDAEARARNVIGGLDIERPFSPAGGILLGALEQPIRAIIREEMRSMLRDVARDLAHMGSEFLSRPSDPEEWLRYSQDRRFGRFKLLHQEQSTVPPTRQ